MSKPSHVFSVSFISQAVKTTLGYIPLYGKWEYYLALFLQQFTHCDPRRTHTSSQEQLDTYFPTSEKGHDKQVNLTLNLSTCVPTSTSSKKAWTFEFYLLWWYYSEFSKTENILKKAWLGSILWVDDDEEEQSWEHMPFYYKKNERNVQSINLTKFVLVLRCFLRAKCFFSFLDFTTNLHE